MALGQEDFLKIAVILFLHILGSSTRAQVFVCREVQTWSSFYESVGVCGTFYFHFTQHCSHNKLREDINLMIVNELRSSSHRQFQDVIVLKIVGHLNPNFKCT